MGDGNTRKNTPPHPTEKEQEIARKAESSKLSRKYRENVDEPLTRRERADEVPNPDVKHTD